MTESLDVGELSRRYGSMVLRRCRRLLRDESDAVDAAQDVFVRVLEKRERLTGQFPSSLLYRMATNVCLNRIRDRSRRPEGHGIGAAAGDDDELYQWPCGAIPLWSRSPAKCVSASMSAGVLRMPSIASIATPCTTDHT